MGVTFVNVTVKNPEKPTKSLEKKFLVDGGATYSVVPGDDLKRLGIKPHRKQTFLLADGTTMDREIGDAIFEIDGMRAVAPVVFGKKGDSLLLGVMTLEAIGLILDPFQRTLKPMKLLMV